MSPAARFGAALSTEPDAARAVAECCAAIEARLGGVRPSIALVFASPDLALGDDRLAAAIHRRLAPDFLIGCTGEAIVGTGREVEGAPALSVWAAALPEVQIEAAQLEARQVAGAGLTISGWPFTRRRGDAAPTYDDRLAILLADPFTFPVDDFLREVNRGGGPLVAGGLASGGRRVGEHRLFFGSETLAAGAVALILTGARATTLVSQGCMPLGPDMVITAADGPTVRELASTPATLKLQRVIDDLEPDERRLADQGVMAGLVIDENLPDYGPGDYLIRALRLGEPGTDSILVGERVRIGQTLRLHTRDADAAGEDLRLQLRGVRARLGGDPAGVLLFTCNGRGIRMFATPDHDATTIQSEFGDIPSAGYFCNGEIGAVGGRNFLHGFSASLVLFGT